MATVNALPNKFRQEIAEGIGSSWELVAANLDLDPQRISDGLHPGFPPIMAARRLVADSAQDAIPLDVFNKALRESRLASVANKIKGMCEEMKKEFLETYCFSGPLSSPPAISSLPSLIAFLLPTRRL